MGLGRARWLLAGIWFPSCAFFVLLLIAQTIGGAYGSEAAAVFGWGLPNFLPTLSLMVSVFAADALSPAGGEAGAEATVRPGFFRLTAALSVFYIVLLFGTLLAQPFFRGGLGTEARLTLMQEASLWLAPVQGLVVSALGVLFFGAKKEEKA